MKPSQRALVAEFRHLEKPAERFPGRVYGCKRWHRGCADRIVVTPPYGNEPITEKCGTHGLPMTTKIVETRIIGGNPAAQPGTDRKS